jgi:bifunctional UDP-N-acetylglucosamine pyrophosphorylase/glucosamine-1-phosphate N-acetyltransferase
MSIPLHIIILAAGDGTRMKSRLPKVLLPLAGRPMLAHVFDAARQLVAEKIHIVFNPEFPEVPAAIDDAGVNWVPQAERLGTGHAVQQAMPEVPDEARVLVLYGDLPLVTPLLLRPLLEAQTADLGVLTMHQDEPAGYGRVLRDKDGRLVGIVEEKDATNEQRAIQEVNSGILLARAAGLRRWLDGLGRDNNKGEYYLTDVVAAAQSEGVAVEGLAAQQPQELAGANDAQQLAALESRFRARQAAQLMHRGVRIADPARLDVRGQVEAGSDVSLDVNVVLEGRVVLGDGVQIGPGCVVRDCQLAGGTRVHAYSVLEGVRSHGPCDIGPFARLRPGTDLGAGSRVGNFVEVKNTSLGEGSKASHLSYLGDSSIGREVNIGAGTITCNYDGANKHRTVIGDGVFIGSDTQLVAPVTVGKDATIGAGSTITQDVPEDKLTLSRVKQVTVDGWQRPRKEKGDK